MGIEPITLCKCEYATAAESGGIWAPRSDLTWIPDVAAVTPTKDAFKLLIAAKLLLVVCDEWCGSLVLILLLRLRWRCDDVDWVDDEDDVWWCGGWWWWCEDDDDCITGASSSESLEESKCLSDVPLLKQDRKKNLNVIVFYMEKETSLCWDFGVELNSIPDNEQE